MQEPSFYALIVVVVTCIACQMNYLNKYDARA